MGWSSTILSIVSPSTVTTTSSSISVPHDWSSSIMRIVSSDDNSKHNAHVTQTTGKSNSLDSGDRSIKNAVGKLDNNVNTDTVNITSSTEQQFTKVLTETDREIKTNFEKTVSDKNTLPTTNCKNGSVDTDDDDSGMPELRDSSDSDGCSDGGFFKNVTSKVAARSTKRKYVKSGKKKFYLGEKDTIVEPVDTNYNFRELPQLVDSSESDGLGNDSHADRISCESSILNTEGKFVENDKSEKKLCQGEDEDCGRDRAKKTKITKVERILAINATCLIAPRVISPAVVQTINNTFKKVLFFTTNSRKSVSQLTDIVTLLKFDSRWIIFTTHELEMLDENRVTDILTYGTDR